MATRYHDLEVEGSIHIPNDLTYANQAARLAATGLQARHIGRLAKQTDDNSYWVLTNYSPVTWKPFTPPAPTITEIDKILKVESNGESDVRWTFDDASDHTHNIDQVIVNGGGLSTLDDFFDYHLSTTSLSGFDLTDNGDGTISLTAGIAILRDADSNTSNLAIYDIGETINLSLADESINHIYCDYNAGSPKISVSTNPVIGIRKDIAVIYTFVRKGTTLYYIDLRGQAVNESFNSRLKSWLADGVKKASGGIMTISSYKPVISTASLFFLTSNIIMNGIDCTASDTFTRVYRNGVGGFTYVPSQNTIPYGFYDNGTGTLATVSNNKWGNYWFYAVKTATGSKWYMVYGVGSYATQSAALDVLPPTTVPVELGTGAPSTCMFQVTYQGDGSLYAIIDLLKVLTKTISSTVLHNELTGKQGGTLNEYYHITADQHAGIDDSYSAIFEGLQGPSGFPNLTDSVVSYNPATQTISIAPAVASFDYFKNGFKYTVTSTQQKTHTNATGVYWFYWDSTNTLQCNTTPWDIFVDVPIARIAYNASLVVGYYYEKRYSSRRNLEASIEFQNNIGVYWTPNDGLAISDYTLQPSSPVNSDNQFSIASGYIREEDLTHPISGVTSGTYKMMSRVGATGIWTPEDTSVPLFASGSYLQWNEWTGATWQKTEAANNNYVNYFIAVLGVVDDDYDVLIFPGQQAHTTLASAQAETIESIDYGIAIIQDILISYKVTYKTNSAYTTTGKCRVEEVIDSRRKTGAQAILGTASVNHNSLAGLMPVGVTSYFHLTEEQHTDLTGGGETTLHTHSESIIARDPITPVSGSTHTVAITDQKICVYYTTTGAVTVTIDSDNTVDGRIFSITDTGGNAGTYNITIETEGSETINGSSNKVINSNFGSLIIFSDGSNYFAK